MTDDLTFLERIDSKLRYGYGTNAVLGGVAGALGFFLLVPDPETSWVFGGSVGALLGLLKVLLVSGKQDRDLDFLLGITPDRDE
jgi:hypothetical protein